MKSVFRTVVFLALVGGWALAAASVYVVRTPAKLPAVILKNEFGYRGTYVDTRNWSLGDDREHPVFVTRVLQVGRGDLLAHTVPGGKIPVNDQLMAAITVQDPASPLSGGSVLISKVK